jgi:hypothetical protein
VPWDNLLNQTLVCRGITYLTKLWRAVGILLNQTLVCRRITYLTKFWCAVGILLNQTLVCRRITYLTKLWCAVRYPNKPTFGVPWVIQLNQTLVCSGETYISKRWCAVGYPTEPDFGGAWVTCWTKLRCAGRWEIAIEKWKDKKVTFYLNWAEKSVLEMLLNKCNSRGVIGNWVTEYSVLFRLPSLYSGSQIFQTPAVSLMSWFP